MKKINFKYIAFTLVVLLIIGIFAIRVLILTHNRNIGFDSQEFFINGGYKDAYNNATSKVEEDNQYIKDNGTRIASYNIDFEAAIKDIEDGKNEDVLAQLNKVENNVADKELFKEDVKVILGKEYLTLNIKAYNMVQENVTEGRSDLYYKLMNIETVYDAFTNDIEISKVDIADNASEGLEMYAFKEWRQATINHKINTIVIACIIVLIVAIIYSKIRGKKITLLIVIIILLIGCTVGYRIKERSYIPAYELINTLFDVNESSKDGYFINFIPIVAVDTFVSNGGNFNVGYDDTSNESIRGPIAFQTVDWGYKKSINSWLNAPYAGNIDASNRQVLADITNDLNYMESDEDDSKYGIGEWGLI